MSKRTEKVNAFLLYQQSLADLKLSPTKGSYSEGVTDFLNTFLKEDGTFNCIQLLTDVSKQAILIKAITDLTENRGPSLEHWMLEGLILAVGKLIGSRRERRAFLEANSKAGAEIGSQNDLILKFIKNAPGFLLGTCLPPLLPKDSLAYRLFQLGKPATTRHSAEMCAIVEEINKAGATPS